MKIIEKDVMLPAVPALGRLCPHGQPLFLDIETTGLSADHSQVYLVGCCYPAENTWKFVQWFAESPRDEEALLRACSAFIKPFALLIHFNGDHFDLPFLHRRAARYGIQDCFLELPSLDLYKKLRPCRDFLGLLNCKLKTIEAFLGLGREDEWDGGQLIDVYRAYVRHPDAHREHLLLLHNEEDILGMPRLLPALTYAEFLGGRFSVTELTDREEGEAADTFLLRLSLCFPEPVLFRESGWQGYIRENALRLTVPRFTGELKYFLADYRSYYYLPAEDTAVHKSVAAYVDRDFRRQATPKTCYLRREGTFLKLPGDMGRQVFRPEFGGDCYLEQEDASFSDPAFWEEYLKRLVCLLH